MKPATALGLALALPDIERVDLGSGSFVLRSRTQLRPHVRCVGDWLERWAHDTPDTVFLAERDASGEAWRRLTYWEVLQSVGGIAQALLNMGLSSAAPVVILSDNSVDAALLKLAAMHVGIPVAILSSAYTRSTKDHSKLFGLLRLLGPGLMYASDGTIYGNAMRAAEIRCPLVFSANADGMGMDFGRLQSVQETAEVANAFARVTPDTHAKYLLTSGSTGAPKAVINTHRMLCANQEAIAQVWPFIEEKPPVLLDWLPWSHTFGANHNFNMILRNGGTLYIDDGRPVPGMIEKSVRNLMSVKPTLYMNVPKGFDAMLPMLEQDVELAAHLFSNLDAIFFAAAALPKQTSERLKALANKLCVRPMFFTSAWGATETSPLVTSVHFQTDHSANIGLPVPGMELKFVPNGDKLEMRVRGTGVFPGYRGAPDLTTKAFDAEGYYLIGDAGRLVDPDDPNAGVLFDGRVSEDFKLTTGTWVSVGTLRVAAVGALSPLVQDAVVTGHGRDELGLLLFPSPAMRRLAGDQDGNMPGELLAGHPAVREHIAQGLATMNQGKGSASSAMRAAILSEQPDLGRGETTDKGYINQRAVLELRAHEVERLYGDGPSVIRPAHAGQS
ncbi:AMP-binding protein [Duganella sp. FT135W]|uniref:AMP-binding protein n=2 Tax=Duganella flavida TaxID=2692175 RepID=A0A6L8KNX7_9BURK|nr:AMP-binding protein [Duganella flavida]